MSEPERGHQLGTRLVVGPLVIAVVAGLMAFDATRRLHYGLGLVLALLVAAALAEFYGMTGAMGHRPFRRLGIFLATLLTAVQWWWLQTDRRLPDPMPAMLVAILTLSFLRLLWRPKGERRIEDAAFTLMGLFYVWLPLSFALRLRMDGWGYDASPLAGHAALAFAVAAGKGSDIGAYFVGSRLGRHLLAPSVSPKKTWEGMGGAVLGGAAFGWAVAAAWPDAMPASPLQAGILGVLLGPLGQLADLGESLLKRQAGVKDSGALLPALGGILDLMDSLILVLPAAYYGLLLCQRMAP